MKLHLPFQPQSIIKAKSTAAQKRLLREIITYIGKYRYYYIRKENISQAKPVKIQNYNLAGNGAEKSLFSTIQDLVSFFRRKIQDIDLQHLWIFKSTLSRLT